MVVVQAAGGYRHVRQQRAVDRISNLPPHITQSILQGLSLRDAVRTSILSRHWRYLWVSHSRLILDDKFSTDIRKKFIMSDSNASKAYLNVVDKIMFCHDGPVHKFVLHIPSWLEKGIDISHWVEFVSNHGVKEFTLYDTNDEVMLPSCLFSNVGLTYLTLINTSIPSLPSTFRGFPSLISLELKMSFRRVTEAKSLELLISNSLKLETLRLYISNDDFPLNIYSPNLQELSVRGMLAQICLAAGTVHLKTLAVHARLFKGKVNITQLFSCLPNVEKLVLSDNFWQSFHLSNDVGCHGKLPNELGRLITLELAKLPLNCPRAISFALCLFRSSPHLQQLIIDVGVGRPLCKASQKECCSDVSPEVEEDCSLQCLKNVQLTGISGLSCGLQLIKFLLACSPVLEIMIIKLSEKMCRPKERLNMDKELMLYHRASPKARISFDIPVLKQTQSLTRQRIYEKVLGFRT